MVLMEPGQEYAEREGLAVLATWTDWDLEICLNNECSRKQIKKSNFLNQWIDIRATYRVNLNVVCDGSIFRGIMIPAFTSR